MATIYCWLIPMSDALSFHTNKLPEQELTQQHHSDAVVLILLALYGDLNGIELFFKYAFPFGCPVNSTIEVF